MQSFIPNCWFKCKIKIKMIGKIALEVIKNYQIMKKLKSAKVFLKCNIKQINSLMRILISKMPISSNCPIKKY